MQSTWLLPCIHFLFNPRTLQKIDSCLRVQQDLGTIKRLFKQSELVAQLETCEAEFKVAVEDFTVGYLVL
jgi:hypothetical protein